MTEATATAPAERRVPRPRNLGLSRFTVVGVWGLLVAIYALVQPDVFLTSGTFQTIFGSQQALVFLGLALVCTLVVGELDLSVASMMGLSATIVPVLAVNHGTNVVLAACIAIAAAVLIGLLNGLIVVVLGIDAIVTTLGMSTLVLGIALKLADSSTVTGLSDSFARISNTPLGSLPITFYYGVVIAVVLAYVLGFTPLGRHMTFVGVNREVARLAGVRVRRIRIGAFIVSGVICGVGGVLLVAGLGGYNPTTTPTYLLPALSAVFLGTAVIQPGRFNPIGTMVAVYFLVTGIVGLQLLGYSGWVSDVFYGAALIVAVVVSTLTRRRSLDQ